MKHLTVQLPLVARADDYHTFEYIREILSKLSSTTVSCLEVDSDPNASPYEFYTAIFYTGKEPTEKQIQEYLNILPHHRL